MPRQFSGPALRHARLAAGLSPERLAVDVDRSVWSIQSYELGRAQPSVPALAQLATALDVPIDALFTSEAEVTAGVA